MVLCACSALARTQRGAFDDALLLRGFARLLTGARGMPTEAETLHLIAGSKPPPVFTDPHTGRQMAHTVAWSAC